MSRYYGGVQGNRGEATRGGSKASGYYAYAQGWQGKITVRLWHDPVTDKDWFIVERGPGPSGSGRTVTIARGLLEADPYEETATVQEPKTPNPTEQETESLEWQGPE